MVQQLSLVALVSAILLGAQPAAAPTPIAGAASTPAASIVVGEGWTIPPVLQQRRPLHLVLAPTGNEARYKVREQLASISFPSDAVGKTSKVEGALMIGADGKINKDSSRFTVDLASIVSDQSRRDNYVRTRTLQTAEFPTAVFVPSEARGMPWPLPATGEITFDLIGDMTIHGVTKQAMWKVKAKPMSGGMVMGTAATEFKFGDYNMPIPRVASVLSVDDHITLEYDFHLVPKAPSGL